MLHQYCVGYRFRGVHAGKEFVKGFVGTSPTDEASAVRDAEQKVRHACEAIGEEYDNARLIQSNIGVTTYEMMQLRDDWHILIQNQ